jgi:hypothetical protein
LCDRRIDRLLWRAHSLKSTNPRAAAAIWAQIDRPLVASSVHRRGVRQPGD